MREGFGVSDTGSKKGLDAVHFPRFPPENASPGDRYKSFPNRTSTAIGGAPTLKETLVLGGGFRWWWWGAIKTTLDPGPSPATSCSSIWHWPPFWEGHEGPNTWAILDVA